MVTIPPVEETLVGRMPAEHGLPQYVSKHPDTGIYRYFRRPPKGVSGVTFVRSFGTRDKKAVGLKYGPIHAEAEAYFARLVSGLTLNDTVLTRLAGLMFWRCLAH